VEELQKQVRRAQRRLTFQRFVNVLGWYLFAALLVAMVLVVVDKWWPLGVPSWAWGAGALGVGMLAALVWTLATRQQALAAAIEIDRRFGLKERVSSALALESEDRETEIGRALLGDADRRVRRIEVSERFRLKPGRHLLLPLGPGIMAILAALLIPPAMAEKPADPKQNGPQVKKQVKNSAEDLRRKMAERREEAEKQGLKDAERLFKRLEEGSKDLVDREADRKKALVELNDLSRQLQARREKLGGADKVKEQLNQLGKVDRGPADKFAQAVAKGDFKEAAEQLDKLKEQLNNSKLDAKQKEELAKQLDQLKDKLEQMAASQQGAMQDLKDRIAQMQQAGQTAEADKLQQQLNQLMQQAPQMDQLGQMAQQMGQCAQCLRNGKLQDAADAMKQLQAGLNGMQQQLDELKMLEDAMGQIAQARNQMNCPLCNGMGCQACQGAGFGQGPGDGMGKGQGFGARPEADGQTSAYDSQVRQKIGPGVADVTGEVYGPNAKGKAQQEIQQELNAVRQGTADPLTDQQIPRSLRDHAEEYFNRFREGQ
jgi:rubrerythrin